MSGQSLPPTEATRARRARRTGLGAGLALLLAAGGCTDVRDYTGTYSGGIVSNVHLRRGFAADTQITLTITQIDRSSLAGRLTLTPSEGRAGFTDRELRTITESRNDVLGDLRFDGDPLGSYLFFVEPDDPAEDHALVLISVHQQGRLEVRVLREDLYGIFRLGR